MKHFLRVTVAASGNLMLTRHAYTSLSRALQLTYTVMKSG